MVEHRSDETEVAAPHQGRHVRGSTPAPRSTWSVRWGERLGRSECPYIKRWVLETPAGSLRLHHWYSSDDDRYPHDHPWWFVTVVLSGSYTDVSYRFVPQRPQQHWLKIDPLRQGSLRYRPAHHKHWVKVPPTGCWTLIVTGPKERQWGFWVPRKLDSVYRFVRASRYFWRYGSHQCE